MSSDKKHSKGRMKKIIGFILFIVIISIFFAVIQKHINKLKAAKAKAASTKIVKTPLPVTVVKAKKEPIWEYVFATGTVKAVQKEYCYFEATGKITFIKQISDSGSLRYIKEGDQVKKGELLSQVDPRGIEQDIKVAEASLQEAQANLQNSQIDENRNKKLYASKAISQVKYERAKIKTINSKTAFKVAEAKLEQAKLRIEQTKIFAPYDGKVAYMNISKGDYFTRVVTGTSESNTLRQVPIVILQDKEMELTANIPAAYSSLIKKGQNAGIFRPNISYRTTQQTIDNRIPAKVFSVNPAVDPGGRSVQIKIRTNDKNHNLIDGQYASCWIVTRNVPDAITVPYKSLLYENSKAYCFIVKESKVEKRFVSLGIYSENKVQIIKGIELGDKVVIEGKHNVVNSTPVKIIKNSYQLEKK